MAVLPKALGELLIAKLIHEDPGAVHLAEQHDPQCNGKDGDRDQPERHACPGGYNPLQPVDLRPLTEVGTAALSLGRCDGHVGRLGAFRATTHRRWCGLDDTNDWDFACTARLYAEGVGQNQPFAGGPRSLGSIDKSSRKSHIPSRGERRAK